MAKKNSSKTATEKSIQASEPRVITYKGWQGINISDAPIDWAPLDAGHGQIDLPANFLMVQNNLETSKLLGIETRSSSEKIADASLILAALSGDSVTSVKLTGIAKMHKHWLFLAVRRTDATRTYDIIMYRDMLSEESSDNWHKVVLESNDYARGGGHTNHYYSITEMDFFESNLVVAATEIGSNPVKTSLFIGKVSADGSNISIKGTHYYYSSDPIKFERDVEGCVTTNKYVYGPAEAMATENYANDFLIDFAGVGIQVSPIKTADCDHRISIKFTYTTRFGTTTPSDSVDRYETSPGSGVWIPGSTCFVDVPPSEWDTSRYLVIYLSRKSEDYTKVQSFYGVTGVDFYYQEGESDDWAYCGHLSEYSAVDFDNHKIVMRPIINMLSAETAPAQNHIVRFYWYGAMQDTSQWINAPTNIPKENTSKGVEAAHFNCHDSRMYFWGTADKPYRLWIGGNAGAEFSVARGLGGAWIDIEPGSGYDIKGTAKWKTAGGSNIVTILTGNKNTNKVKRFNLVETNLTLTNEISYKSYMYEEVPNVVGCMSRHGFGVYSDGLYTISRYGLMLTTMAMEYNNQMKEQEVSAPIAPVFTELLANQLADTYMECINEVIYIIIPTGSGDYGNVIFCYDIGLKAWYTFTCDQTIDADEDTDKMISIFSVDSIDSKEGLGVVTESEARLYPTTMPQATTVPVFNILLETAELMPRMPMQAFWYVQQLELRFDYFIGDPTHPAEVLIEGTDYYGRDFSITKQLNIKSRGHHGATGVQRDYIEWIRIDKIVESLRIRIKGKARFRLTHMNMKAYQQADTIGTPYGFDASDSYKDRHRQQHTIHHYINDYNNLRKAVIS